MRDSGPPLPPFTRETAIQKVRAAGDAWNTRALPRMAQGYTIECKWRNRAEIFASRENIIAFLTREWQRKLDHRLIKKLWAFTVHRKSYRGAVRLRIPGRLGQLVACLWQ
jgi:uncharacterized protein